MKLFHALVAFLWMFAVTVEAQTSWQLGGNRYSPDSSGNPYSTFNNRYSPDSPRNPYGQYGNRYNPNAAGNPYGRGLEVTPSANNYDSWAKRFR